MFKKIIFLILFLIVFFISFYSDLFRILLNVEASKLSALFKHSKIELNDFALVKTSDDTKINEIIKSFNDSKTIIFDCFTDFNKIKFLDTNKYYSTIVYYNSNNLQTSYTKNNFSFTLDKNKPISLTSTLPNDLNSINASGFFEFDKINGDFYFKLIEKTNNKIIFSLPLAIYLEQTNFKKIEVEDEYLKVVKETTGSDVYINFSKDYYFNLGSKLFDLKEINYNKFGSLNSYKNIIISKCNDYSKDRAKLLAMAISNTNNKIFIPKYYAFLSLLIIIIFFIFCFSINFIKLKYYKLFLLIVLMLCYFILALFSYIYADIHIPILFTLVFGMSSYLFSFYVFFNRKTNITYEGEAILIYSSFKKIDFPQDVFNPEVINIIGEFWNEYEKFVTKNGGINIFTTSKSRLCFWPSHILNKVDFEAHILKIKEKYLKALSSVDEEFIKKFKPQMLIDYGKIYFDSKLKSSYGQIINRVQNLAKINKKYTSFVLLSQAAYQIINKKNVFYPIDINLYALDWEIKFDIKQYLVYFDNFTKHIDQVDLNMFEKFIENDENTSFKVLNEKLNSLVNSKLEE